MNEPINPKRVAAVTGGVGGGAFLIYILTQLAQGQAELRSDARLMQQDIKTVSSQAAAAEARSAANEKGTDRQFSEVKDQLNRVLDKLDERPRGRR